MTDHARIRELNDEFRKGLSDGRLMVTQGISKRCDVWEIVQQVRKYNSFDRDNDPYDEHDFGTIMVDDQHIFWKLDLYSTDLEAGSPDPTDPSVTTRVLTIMLAEEY
jgi:hypothetical protein